MEIKLSIWEVETAITEYLNKEYGLDIEESTRDTPMNLEIKRPTYAYKKHKNGKFVKDKHGHKVFDYANTTYETDYEEMHEDCNVCIDIF